MGRIERINQQMKREISHILLADLADPRLQFVTILEVDVSKDLRNAKVYYSVLGNPEQARKAHGSLEGAAKMIRRLIGQRLTMRYTPEIKFFYDNTIDRSAKIEQTLQELKNESQQRRQDT